jgi:hypothetical protein
MVLESDMTIPKTTDSLRDMPGFFQQRSESDEDAT